MMSIAVRGSSLVLLAASLLHPGAATLPKVSEVEAEHVGNLCEDESDGWQCHDDYAVQCLGGKTIAHQACASYQECKEGLGTASCVEDACDDKQDGLHCNDDDVVQCLARTTVKVTECPFYQECKRDKLQPNMAACQEDVCEDEADGTYCEDDHVVECENFKTVKFTKCAFTEECKKDALGINKAACVEDLCDGKADGKYCKRDGVVTCEGQKTQSFSACHFYQECTDTLKGGAYVATCEEDACDDETDGWHCKGDHMVRCSGLQTVEVKLCPSFQECEEQPGAPTACK